MKFKFLPLFSLLQTRFMGNKMASPKLPVPDNAKRVTLGLGCYWGSQKYYVKDFGQKLFPGSIVDSWVGFMGGNVSDPSYREVCNGNTGHVEVVEFLYDPSKCSYEDIVRFFFCVHDPTTLNQQQGDHGTQYASVIFTRSDEEVAAAKKVMNSLQSMLDSGNSPVVKKSYSNKKIVTAIRPASIFYPAHEEHQDYLDKNPGGYCSHRYYLNFDKFQL